MPRPKRAPDILTERELQIIGLVATGAEDKMIAQKLGLSPLTVRNHLKKIRGILGNLNRVQLAVWFIRNKETV